MLDGGADPLYVGRRMIRMASEDIGLADPRALRSRSPRSRPTSGSARPKASWRSREAVLYLAVAPKSNAVYTAYDAARAFIAEDGSRPVPLRLRNAPTKLMKDLGYGKGYRYAHDEEDAYAAGEHYFPDDMPDVTVLRADRSRPRGEDPRKARRAARARPEGAAKSRSHDGAAQFC